MRSGNRMFSKQASEQNKHAISTKNFAQYEHEKLRRNSTVPQLWDLLEQVKDPEIPALSLWDIGILKNIQCEADAVTVTITPTYSGCPAMDVIREDVEKLLHEQGYHTVNVITKLSPAWTTDWMTSKGREKLRGYGIAPPEDIVGNERDINADTQVKCPHCKSHHTKLISEFSSTACKALFQCESCNETFDLFKNI